MSSAAYAAPLFLELKPSPRLTAVLAVMHGGALVLLWQLDIAWPWALALSFVISWSLAASVSSHALRRHDRGITALEWDADGRWRLWVNNGEALEAVLKVGSYVHPRLVVLNFKAENRRFPLSVVILWNSLPAEQFRRLRVRLRLEGGRPEVSTPY